MPSLWDALLVNAIDAVLVDPTGHTRELEQAIRMAEAALPQTSRDDPRILKASVVAQRLIDAWPHRAGNASRWMRDKLRAGEDLAAFHRWRAAELHRQLTEGSGRP